MTLKRMIITLSIVLSFLVIGFNAVGADKEQADLLNNWVKCHFATEDRVSKVQTIMDLEIRRIGGKLNAELKSVSFFPDIFGEKFTDLGIGYNSTYQETITDVFLEKGIFSFKIRYYGSAAPDTILVTGVSKQWGQCAVEGNGFAYDRITGQNQTITWKSSDKKIIRLPYQEIRARLRTPNDISNTNKKPANQPPLPKNP